MTYDYRELLDHVPDHVDFHSPVMLCQEAVGGYDEYERGWRVILASMFCVRTARHQSHPTLWRFLSEWPTCSSVAFSSNDAQRRMRDLIRPCGFQNVRTRQIVLMSKNYVMDVRPPEIHGCGPYVHAAYKIFVDKHYRFVPDDGHLVRYLSWKLRSK